MARPSSAPALTGPSGVCQCICECMRVHTCDRTHVCVCASAPVLTRPSGVCVSVHMCEYACGYVCALVCVDHLCKIVMWVDG